MHRLLVVFLILGSVPVRALDPGWSPRSVDGWRAEVVGEHYKRDIEQETRGGSGAFVGRQREDRLWLRVDGQRGKWHGAVLAGLSDAQDALDPAPAGGVVVERVLVSAPAASLSLFAGAVLVEGIEYRNTGGQVGPYVIADDTREESHLEAGGGLRWNWRLDVGSGVRVEPYAGLFATLIRGEGREAYAFPEGVPVRGARRGEDADVDFQEDGVLGALAGLGVGRETGPGLRLEARWVDRAVYSAGLSWAF